MYLEDYSVDNTNKQEEQIITNEKKELTYTPSLYKRISDKYYAIIDKLHLRPLTNVIDKVMPSMIFFALLAIIIIVLIIYIIIAGMGPSINDYSLTISLNGKAYTDNYTIALSGSDSLQLLTPAKTKGETKFSCAENQSLTANITMGKEKYTKTFVNDKSKIILELFQDKKPTVSNTNEKTENLFSFILTTPNGTLNKSGTLKVSCDAFSQDYPISNGILNNIKIPCKSVSVSANVENIPPVTQMCSPGVCKINMSDNLSTDKIKEVLPTNKLIIYVNNKDGSSAQNINVEVRDDSLSQELVDSGTTRDFGSYNVDLVIGEYVVNISDPSGKFGPQQKKVKVTAGSLDPLIFVLDLPAIGNIVVDFDVEDSNVVSGTLYLKDLNYKIIQTKQFDSNVDINFAITEKNTYYISTNLNYTFSDDYIGQDDLEVVYDLDSGDKTIDNYIRKLNPQLDQNIVVQVTELQTGKPIPFAKIYFTTSDTKLLSSIDVVTTDANGIYSHVLTKGVYFVYLLHYKLSGVAPFNIVESKAVSLTTQNVNLRVNWGNSLVNVCLFNNKNPIDNARIEIYSVERGSQGLYILDKDKTCIPDIPVKRLESIYFKVTKEDYFDLYSQTFFMKNEADTEPDYDVSLNISPIINTKQITELESEFLGIYNENELITESKELAQDKEYYYAFKARLPKAKAIEGNNLNFYTVAGDKQEDEDADYSKLINEYINAFSNNILYSNYNKEFDEDLLNIAEIDESTDKYKSKSSYSNYAFDEDAENDLEIIYTVLVRATNNSDPEQLMGDDLFYYYDFTLNDDPINLKSILKKIGTQYCNDPVCVDALMGGLLLQNSYTVPAKGTINGIVYFNNSENKNLTIYNKSSNSANKKSDIVDLFVTMNNGKLKLNDIYGVQEEMPLSIGPFYYDSNVNVYSADFSFDYESISDKDSSIIFRTYYNNWDNNSSMGSPRDRINIDLEETDTLDVENMPDYIVPFVSNKFIISVVDPKQDDNPINKAEVKYYIKDNLGNWMLKYIKLTGISGNVEIVTDASVGINGESKFVIYSNGYKPLVITKKSDFSYFTAKDSKLTFSYPDDPAITTDNNVEVYNDSDLELNQDINVFNLFYTLDATKNADAGFVDLFLDAEAMQYKFIDGELIKPKSKLKLQVNYAPDVL
jgi:hypothetical protein